MFTRCLRIVYAKFENKQLYINVFQWLFTFAFTLSKALLLKKRIFEIKPSDYSLVRSRKSIQTALCLRKIFHNVILWYWVKIIQLDLYILDARFR